LAIGDLRLGQVDEAYSRCDATNVDPRLALATLRCRP
jgi:hypothetical protein